MPWLPTTSPLVNSRATSDPANAIGPAFSYTNLASRTTSNSRRSAATFNGAPAASETAVAASTHRLLPLSSRRRAPGSATTLPGGHVSGPTAGSSTSTWDSWTASKHYANNSTSTSSRTFPPPSWNLPGMKPFSTMTASATRRRSATARTAPTTPRTRPAPSREAGKETESSSAPMHKPSLPPRARLPCPRLRPHHQARLPSLQLHAPGSL